MIISKFDLILKNNGIQNSLSSHSLTTEPLVLLLKVRLVFAVFSVPGIGGFGTATHKGIKHYSLRDKRDFDDEENESLSKGTSRHTHRRRGILCKTKKNISTQKKMCLANFFFPSFLGFY